MRSDGYESLMVQAAKDLSKPAGESPDFSSRDAISQHRKDYVVECHKTWKKWHNKAIHEILVYEAFMHCEKTHPIGDVAVEWANYNQDMWRRVNDAIIWCLTGLHRHVVKRLCLYRKRAYLSESNPVSVMETLARLNANPLSIAIWNDATSCVDIGDVTYVADGTSPEPKFLELKEGVVNNAIVDLISTGPEDRDEKMKAFADKYGENGLAQAERVARQGVTVNQALTLLNDEKGTDPVTGKEIRVVDTSTPSETYDDILNEVLRNALRGPGAATNVVDGCLWIYASADKTVTRNKVADDFHQLLAKGVPHYRKSLNARRPAWDKDRIVCLNDTFGIPLAKPLFLRKLDSSIIGSVIYGDLMFRSFLYLDWEKFGEVVKEEGGEFLWSSEKDARRARAAKRELQPVIASGRVPQIRVGPAVFSVTDAMLVEMLFDGITPQSVVKTLIEVARLPNLLP